MLLNSPPTSLTYKNLVTTLMWVKETLILKEIISALLSFNLRKKIGDENSKGEELVVRSNQECGKNKSRNESRNNKSRSKSNKKKDIQRYKCGKIGYITQECLEKKKGDVKNKENSSKSMNVVEENSESDDGDMLSISSSLNHPIYF